MTKKYDFTIQQSPDGFTARVVRRRTSQGTKIEHERGGFADRAAAIAWGEAALAEYLSVRRDRNERRRAVKAARRDRHAWLDQQTLQQLAQMASSQQDAASTLKQRADLLWQEIAFRAMRRGETEDAAIDLADRVVGKNWTQRLAKALCGDLDHAHEAAKDMAFSNAARLARIVQRSGR